MNSTPPSIYFDPTRLTTDGGTLRDTLTLALLWAAAWVLRPFQMRGLCRVSSVICTSLRSSQTYWVRKEEDVTLPIDVKDWYWIRLLAPFFVYEPELHCVFRRLRQVDYVLVDAGANIGYWSTYASSTKYGSHRVIAIEALRRNFERLRQTCLENNNRFETVHAALSDVSGTSVTISGQFGHATASVVYSQSDQHAATSETIKTITLDAINTRYLRDAPLIVVKLDIEGAEIDALRGGAGELLAKQPLIIYEDHGRDVACSVSAYLLNDLGYYIAYVEDGGLVRRLSTIDEIFEIKINPVRGYNFVACSPQSPFVQHLFPARQPPN